MKQSPYSLWVLISLIAALAVILGLSSYLKNNKRAPAESPSPSSSATVSPSASPSGEASPTPAPTATPTGTTVSNRDAAKAAYEKGDYPTAIAKYILAIAEVTDKKDQATLNNLLGNAYRDNKSLTLAIESYNKAIALDPNLVAAYVNLSNVYVSQNKNSDAKATLEKGLQANPGNAQIERELSIVNLTGTGGDRQ